MLQREQFRPYNHGAIPASNAESYTRGKKIHQMDLLSTGCVYLCQVLATIDWASSPCCGEKLLKIRLPFDPGHCDDGPPSKRELEQSQPADALLVSSAMCGYRQIGQQHRNGHHALV